MSDSHHSDEVLFLTRLADEGSVLPDEATRLRRIARYLDRLEVVGSGLYTVVSNAIEMVDDKTNKPMGCDGPGCSETALPDGSFHWVCRGLCDRAVKHRQRLEEARIKESMFHSDGSSCFGHNPDADPARERTCHHEDHYAASAAALVEEDES